MKTSLLCFLCVFFLTGCGGESEPMEEDTSIPSRTFSEAYAPPRFENDDRLEKVGSVAERLKEMIESHSQNRHIPGVAYGIVVGDSLVVSGATGLADLEGEIPASTTTAFRIASMTKSFTAMAILKLRDEGKLSLEDPARDYIPEMAGLEYLTSDSPDIDIENLLTMTAGFPEDNPWGDRQLDEPDTMLMELMEGGVSFSNTPSYTYEYSNTGYALLGHVVTRVSGMPYQEYIRKKILEPLGMMDTYWEIDDVPEDQLAIGYRWEEDQWKLEPMLHDGVYGAMGGLITTIEDFSKYVSFHLSAWPPRSEPDNGPVRRSTLREMHTPQFNRLYDKATNAQEEPCPVMTGYGFGLGITNYCNELVRVSHGGALPGFGSNYAFYPEYGIGIMAFCNLTYTTPYPYSDIAEMLFSELSLEKRTLPVSGILEERKAQVIRLIETWDEALADEILAENFYLDRSRALTISAFNKVMDRAGHISESGPISPENQLRGSFPLIGKNGTVQVVFTLSPEKDPKVQYLDLSFEPSEEE